MREDMVRALTFLKGRWANLLRMTTQPSERREGEPLVPEAAALAIARLAPQEMASIDLAIARLQTDDSIRTMLDIAVQTVGRSYTYQGALARMGATVFLREAFTPAYQTFWNALPAEVKEQIRRELPNVAASAGKWGLALGLLAALGVFVWLKVK